MARRTRKGKESSERWLVSYADLLTLLFAFFVVMFASTQTDKSRAQQISQAVDMALQSSTIGGTAFEPGKITPDKRNNSNSPLGSASGNQLRPTRPSELDLGPTIKALRFSLSTEMNRGQIEIHAEPRGVVISLNTKALFPSGGDVLSDSMLPVLAKVGKIVNGVPNPIRLEGHTDSLPIRNQKFRSNWELSAARSIAMLRLLNERYGVSRDRMAIVGFGDTNAIGDNHTEDGRTRNRRVDVVLLSDFGLRQEPLSNPNGIDATRHSPENCRPTAAPASPEHQNCDLPGPHGSQ